MNCEETKELVDAYADRELDLAKSLELERHLSECGECSKRHNSLLALRSAVSAVYYAPPASLQKRVTSGLRTIRKEEAKSLVVRGFLPWRWIGVAASVVLLSVVSWSVARLWTRP